MSGELLPVWPRTWQEIWSRLAKHADAPDDFFVQLVSDLAPQPLQPPAPPQPSLEAYNQSGELIEFSALEARSDYEASIARYTEDRNIYESALNSEERARAFFRVLLGRVSTESEAIVFLEQSYEALRVYGNDGLITRFRELVVAFLLGFNLRYELRAEFSLHATMSGLFTKLISEVRRIAQTDNHLAGLLSEFEEAFADLRANRTQARMKTCLQKQYNMLEALGRNCPNVTATTLGAICDQLDWPHEKMKEVGKNLYRFGSDYPGVRHGGTPGNALRDLQMRDFVSISLMLASFAPYVTNGLDSDLCYSA